MKVNKIVIACFKHDLFLLRSCVASIRYWYPDVEILLLKDMIKGDFSTAEIEKYWNVGVYPARRTTFGWPWSKLEVLLSDKTERVLFVDSDVVFLGYVLDLLATEDADFVVTGIREPDETSHEVTANYIDMAAMKKFDPSYRYPGFAFNGGQIVMTSGLLDEQDFAPVLELGDTIRNKYPDMLKHGDQGALNYVFVKASQEGKISIAYRDFWLWPGMPEAQAVDITRIKRGEGVPLILHWAGAKPVDFRKYGRFDLLKFFTDYYYAQIPAGKRKHAFRFAMKLAIARLKILKYQILRRQYAA